MKQTIKDTDYLVISARIRAMENDLLTLDRMNKILEARSDGEVAKILQECGYAGLDARNPEAMDAVIAAAREAMLADFSTSVPDPRYIEIFKLKYDYHNAKAILKAAALGTDPERLLMDMGRVPAAELKAAIRGGTLEALPSMLASAIEEGKSILETTRDPQLSDIALDQWYYRDMTAIAEATGSKFLQGYVQSQIDAANLKTLVRTLRMQKTTEFLRGALLEGGSIAADGLLSVNSNRGSGLVALYASTQFQVAAEAGANVLRGASLTEFEKLCDDAVADYLAGSQTIPFGEAPLVGYLAAKETEFTNLRILLSGRKVGLSSDVIQSRLRASYV